MDRVDEMRPRRITSQCFQSSFSKPIYSRLCHLFHRFRHMHISSEIPMTSRMNNHLIHTILSLLPVKHISEFFLKGTKVFLSDGLSGHFDILPNEQNMQSG